MLIILSNNLAMKRLLLLLFACLFPFLSFAQPAGQIPILIRCDDIGMSHSVNMAAKAVLETGLPVSMSVMVPCPWFEEGVEILKQYSNVSIGIHLTLNSEWTKYRWGPVLGASAVPSMVDSLGYFFPTAKAFFDNKPRLDEIEAEMRAQINKAIRAGLKIDYFDYHMRTALELPETRALVEKLAAEYKVALSGYYGETEVLGGYAAPFANKQDTLAAKVKSLQPGNTKLFVFHIAQDTPEMSALEDANPNGLKQVSKHRQAELNTLLSPAFQQLLRDPKYRLVNYGMLNKEQGIQTMKRPGTR